MTPLFSRCHFMGLDYRVIQEFHCKTIILWSYLGSWNLKTVYKNSTKSPHLTIRMSSRKKNECESAFSGVIITFVLSSVNIHWLWLSTHSILVHSNILNWWKNVEVWYCFCGVLVWIHQMKLIWKTLQNASPNCPKSKLCNCVL